MELPFALCEGHVAGCKRGELMLTHDELTQLNTFLAARASIDSGAAQWRFVAVPAAARGLKVAAFAARPVEPHTRARTLPEWALTFQRMLRKYLQSELALPFADWLPHSSEPITLRPDAAVADDAQPVTRHSLHSQHQRDIQLAAQPIPHVLSLKQILHKLEAGGYSTCLAAFNDVYDVFLCGFRHFPPASPHWMLLHNVVSLFLSNTNAFPLRDSFEGPPSVVQYPERRGGSERREKAKAPRRVMAEGATAPVKRKETRALHRILSALSPELHSMLYEEFQTRAVWKAASDGSQVQLDEEATPAPIFREILNWGASRVTWQVPSSKKTRRTQTTTIPHPPPPQDEEPPPPQRENTHRYQDWLSSSDPDRALSTSSSSDNDSDRVPNTTLDDL